MKIIMTSMAVAAMSITSTGAFSQEYPSKPVTLILPTGTGTSMDTLGRNLAENLERLWGQTVVAENRPGAGGAVGSAIVSQAPSDGYTLLFTTNTFTTTAATVSDLSYDAITDFQPISLTARSPLLFAGGSRTGTTSLAELIEYAGTNTVFYGTVGPGSVSRFAAELLSQAADVPFEPVTYPSSTEALVDIMGGRLDLYVGAVASVAPSLQSEGITSLAVSGEQRLLRYPDVPTLAELGLGAAEMGVWWGVLAPAGTPRDIVDKLNADIVEVMSSEDSKVFLEKYDALPAGTGVDEFTSEIKNDIASYKEIAEGN